jgi:hypothetical protein
MQTAHESFLGKTSRDPARGVPLVQVRVRNRNTKNLPLFGNVVPVGEHTITVYKDDVPKILAMVEEDETKVDAAREHFMLEVAKGVKERAGYPGTIAELAAALKSGDGLDDKLSAAYKATIGATPFSIYSSFAQLNGRDMKPLTSAKLVPGSEQTEHHMQAKVEEAQLIRTMLTQQSPQDIAAMIEAAVEKRVEQELARLTAPSSEAKTKPKG